MKILRDHDGMTLLEVLVAIAIFGMMLSGLTGVLVQEQKISRQAQQLLEARLKATHIIETLKTLPFDQLDEASPAVAALRQKDAQILLKNVPDAPDVKHLLVMVSWRTQSGREYQYRLETLRSRHGASSAEGGAL